MDSNDKNKFSDIDALLRGIFKEETLREMFEKRMFELGVNQTSVLKMLQMERKTLLGILDGTQKRANLANLHNLAVFLNVPTEDLIKKHISQLEKNSENDESAANKKKFIRENFDLIVLKKSGFIEDISDYAEIEKRIVNFFGFDSIFEYKKRSFETAFSAGIVVPKKMHTRDFWLTSVKSLASKLDNPYHYDRQALIDYFPQIRWHSTNVEYGLINVIKSLFKLGITVVYRAPMSALHLRGATFSVNGKPCIALTDYKGFYPTLWHCLIHELYHVLFDWGKIKENQYHVTVDQEVSLSLDAAETEADNFAREYLFSASKLENVRLYLMDYEYIKEVAKANHVHPSIIYIYNAYDQGATDRMVWPRTKRQMPDIKQALYRIDMQWNSPASLEDIARKLKIEIYN
ncbi:MAG: hypothetical protein IAE95_02510 [Chitinophagaceae bacterium]|nr:hypothetical protein [Chitinophagaceae bacterium]